MELRHLRYLSVLAEELHFARAAERLNIAPPTLTVQIQEIERTLSAQLLVRTKRSVALTPAGELFLIEARRVLMDYDRAESVGRRAGRGELGRIEIGYVASAAYAGVLQEQISRFRVAWPDIQLNARELEMRSLPDLLVDGKVDVGFVRLPMAMPTALRQHVLLRDHFCLALPTGHSHAEGSAPISARQLASETFISPEQEAGTQILATRGRFLPQIVSAPGSLLAVLTQVSLGTGISVVPEAVRSVVNLPGVTFRKIAGEPISSEVAAIFRADEASPAVQKLIAQIIARRAKDLSVA